jgi:hypothetical protein
VETATVEEPAAISDGFTLVEKPKKTRKPKKTGKPKDSKSVETKKPQVKNASNGNRKRYQEAFKLAEREVIGEWLKLLSGGKASDINMRLHYQLKYRELLKLSYSSDEVPVDIDGVKFVFSRNQFLENPGFQYKVREKTDVLMPDAWVNFSKGREEGTYCMWIQKRRE